MRLRRAGPLALAFALTWGLFTRPVAAQNSAAADTLFEQGMARLKANDFDAACPLFEESHRLDPKPGVLFTLAACEAKRGRIATALTRYEDYLEIVSTLPSSERTRQQARERVARKERDALKANVPMLTIVLPADAPDRVSVKRDGVALGKPSLGVALPVDPGEHIVSVVAAERVLLTEKVTLAAKDQRTVQLPSTYPKLDESTSAPPERESPPPSIPPAAAVAALAVGGAGLALGTVFGILALGRKSVVDEECTGAICRTERGRSAGEDGKTFATVSTVGFVIGALGVAAGVPLFVLSRPAEPTRGPTTSPASAAIVVGPVGVGLVGRF